LPKPWITNFIASLPGDSPRSTGFPVALTTHSELTKTLKTVGVLLQLKTCYSEITMFFLSGKR
jgi:hypothetical protein